MSRSDNCCFVFKSAIASSILSVSTATSRSPRFTRLPCSTALSTVNEVHCSGRMTISVVFRASKTPLSSTSMVMGPCFTSCVAAPADSPPSAGFAASALADLSVLGDSLALADSLDFDFSSSSLAGFSLLVAFFVLGGLFVSWRPCRPWSPSGSWRPSRLGRLLGLRGCRDRRDRRPRRQGAKRTGHEIADEAFHGGRFLRVVTRMPNSADFSRDGTRGLAIPPFAPTIVTRRRGYFKPRRRRFRPKHPHRHGLFRGVGPADRRTLTRRDGSGKEDVKLAHEVTRSMAANPFLGVALHGVGASRRQVATRRRSRRGSGPGRSTGSPPRRLPG